MDFGHGIGLVQQPGNEFGRSRRCDHRAVANVGGGKPNAWKLGGGPPRPAGLAGTVRTCDAEPVRTDTS